MLDLVEFDFDDFMGATLVGPLLFDVSFPVAREHHSTPPSRPSPTPS